MGVFGGHIEVEVGDDGTEREGFPEGWWIKRDSQPSPATLGGSSRKKGRGGHSQEKSPTRREARTDNRAMDPGLQLEPPSVRKGSGESYPDPSETARREKRNQQNT